MLLDIILEINKAKLENLISNNAKYQDILKQSCKLDKYVVAKFKILNPI